MSKVSLGIRDDDGNIEFQLKQTKRKRFFLHAAVLAQSIIIFVSNWLSDFELSTDGEIQRKLLSIIYTAKNWN